MSSALFEGISFGFLIAMIVGPIGILCIQQTASHGFLPGFVTGLGAASADAIYGLIAGLGLTALAKILVDYSAVLSLIGGIFLCYLGISTFFSRIQTSEEEKLVEHKQLSQLYVTTFFLTLSNPTTILTFIGLFAGLGIGLEHPSLKTTSLFVGGVFLGSTLWWLILSGVISRVRKNFAAKHIRLINRLSGIFITGFGVVNLLSVLLQLLGIRVGLS